MLLSGVGAILVTIPQPVYEVARGKNVTLPCSITFQGTGTPKQTIVTWSATDDVLTYYSIDKNTDIGTLYEGRVSLDVDAATANANLKLSSTTLDDNKVFRCHALIPSDKTGKTSATTRLVVLVAPSTPICTIQGKAEYGQNINLTCLSAEGSPPPTYSWQSLDVMNKPRVLPPRTTVQGGILSLYNISKDTSGFFICTSTNKMGSASYNFTLAVMPRERNLLLAAFPLTVWELGIPTKHIFTTLDYNMHPFLLPSLPTRLPCSFHERCLHCRNHWWSNRCVDRAHHRHLLHINQLRLGDPEAFPGQVGDIIPPPSPGSSPRPPPSWTCLEHLPREAPRGHPYQMPEPPQLAPFNAKEQRLYSELLTDD
uniref:Ig-like domain-containing protein n=1 Tax=Sander lucioperca TaxID=283035 RepID=A0A8C9WWX7_SANLU